MELVNNTLQWIYESMEKGFAQLATLKGYAMPYSDNDSSYDDTRKRLIIFYEILNLSNLQSNIILYRSFSDANYMNNIDGHIQ